LSDFQTKFEAIIPKLFSYFIYNKALFDFFNDEDITF